MVNSSHLADKGVLPPQDDDAEKYVLGCVLTHNDTFSEAESLKTSDFYGVQNRLIFAEIVRLKEAGGAFEAADVAIALAAEGKLEEVDGPTYLAELGESFGHAGNLDSYVKRVREKAVLRQLMYAGQRIAAEASEPGMTLEHVQERLARIPELFDDRATAGERFQTYTAAELASGDFAVDYHIPGILAERIPTIIGGSFKTLKTSIAADLHFSLSTGAPFLGKFFVTRPYRTAFMSGESGLSALQSVYHRIAHSRGWSLDRVENLIVSPDLPQLADAADVRRLEQFITDAGIECLMIDPAYLCMSLGNKAGNLFDVGEVLKPLSDLGQKTGCTIIIVHHHNKASASTYEPAELADLQWSGFAEWAAQWLLLSRREKYQPDSAGEHRLWLNCGGRPGHSSLWALDVTEGRQEDDGGRRWDVDVKTASHARAEVAESQQEAREDANDLRREATRVKHRESVLQAFRRHPKGNSKTTLKSAASLNGNYFQPVLDDLMAEDAVVEFESPIRKGQLWYRLVNDPENQLAGQPDNLSCPAK